MNQILINNFELLVKQIKLDIDYSEKKDRLKNMFRLNSIMNVIRIIKSLDYQIIRANQLIGYKGIGKKSLKRIDEILQTGKLSEINNKNFNQVDLIDNLTSVFGIGRKTAYKLFKSYNINSIDELKKMYAERHIVLPKQVIKGLKYTDMISESIPRNEMELMTLILKNATLIVDPQLFGTTCGSYRRLKETSNDIDFILTHNKIITKSQAKESNYLYKFIKILKKEKFIIDSLTSDKVSTKYMGICRLKKDLPLRRIDIRFIPYQSYYFALLYFTGSKELNQRMRLLASNMGYVLNEYGLFGANDKFDVKSEKDIFDLLGMEYLTPSER